MLHRHEALGFDVQAPAGWSVLEESERGLLLGTSVEDGGPGASASVTVEAVEPGAQLAALTSRAMSTKACWESGLYPARQAGTELHLQR